MYSLNDPSKQLFHLMFTLPLCQVILEVQTVTAVLQFVSGHPLFISNAMSAL